MPDRKSEPWESGAGGPFLWIEGCPVGAPGHEQIVISFEEAEKAADRA